MATLKPWDRVAIINTDQRADRWQQITADLSTSALLQAGQPARFTASSPTTCVRPGWFGTGWGDPQQNPSAYWACKQSHLRVIEQAILDGVDHLLVLEDDAMPAADFDERFAAFVAQLPTDWLGYKLGWLRWRLDKVETLTVSPGCVRLYGTRGTHCYGLNREGMQRVFDHLTWHRTEPGDAARASLEREDPRFYGPAEPMVSYRPGFSDLTRRYRSD